LYGLQTGIYKLYGGVIRWAAGTEHAGAIVRHLIPSAAVEVVGNLQPISAMSRQVLQIANGTMIMSGLNLAVSAVGFAVLNEKLNKLESNLKEIQNDVKAIGRLFELEERSRLAAALRDLLNIDKIKNIEHRDAILLNSKNVLAPISLKYKELLAGADDIQLAMAYEEYFCLSYLAHVRCLGELGMFEMARLDLEETNTYWKQQARRIGNDLLLSKAPERFLYNDFYQDMPVSALIEGLDFFYDEARGNGWIDELRSKNSPWYSDENFKGISAGATKMTSSFRSLVKNLTNYDEIKVIEEQKTLVIPYFRKLVARNNVLDGFVTQYEMLEKYNLRPSDFENQIALLDLSSVNNGFFILKPIQEEKFSTEYLLEPA
jgi:hypothetical protein